MTSDSFHYSVGEGPLIAAAIHAGHELRLETLRFINLSSEARLREEDPYTDIWTDIAPTQIIGLRSRFEVDLNRPREKAIYLNPEDAWGLHVWKSPLSDGVVKRSLEIYDEFYAVLESLLIQYTRQFESVVVYDLHTYNHRRSGPDGVPANPKDNPEVNIGTGTLNRERWGSLIDRFISDLSGYDFLGRNLDVRENIKFQGGNFARWIHERFPESVCVLSIELKKFFMDEWTGKPDQAILEAIQSALQSTTEGVIEELAKVR
jgi:N-formylglutamate deformylase